METDKEGCAYFKDMKINFKPPVGYNIRLFKERTASDYKSCRDLCRSNKDCKSWTYNTGDNKCYPTDYSEHLAHDSLDAAPKRESGWMTGARCTQSESMDYKEGNLDCTAQKNVNVDP